MFYALEEADWMKSIVEPKRNVPVVADVDVVVVGGGPGGLPAAIAAARLGVETLLIERHGFLGGLATGGLIGPIFGFSAWRGGIQKQIVGGIPQELIGRMVELGGAPKDPDLFRRIGVPFDPEIFKYVADRMVEESGAQLLLYSLGVNAVVRKNEIEAVIVENKSGRQAITANIVVDATGDGDVAYFAGAPYTKGRAYDRLTQPMGAMFRIGGIKKTTEEEEQEMKQLLLEAVTAGKLRMNAIGAVMSRGTTVRANEVTPNVMLFQGDGANIWDLTLASIKMRKELMDIVRFLKENTSIFKLAHLSETPAQIGVRETRQIIGDYLLKAEDVLTGKKFDDKVAHGSWLIDINCPYGRYRPQWPVCSVRCEMEPPCAAMLKHKDQLPKEVYPKPGSWYDIPYRCLVPKKVENLLVSGRCISATHEAMASSRVMATCMAIGQAAGTAAALAIKEKLKPRKLDMKLLQDILVQNDAILL